MMSSSAFLPLALEFPMPQVSGSYLYKHKEYIGSCFLKELDIKRIFDSCWPVGTPVHAF